MLRSLKKLFKKQPAWKDEQVGGLYGIDHLLWGTGGQRPLEAVTLIAGLSIIPMVKEDEGAAVMLVAKPVGTDTVVPIAKLSEIEHRYDETQILLRTIASLHSLADALSSSLRKSADNLERYEPLRKYVS